MWNQSKIQRSCWQWGCKLNTDQQFSAPSARAVTVVFCHPLLSKSIESIGLHCDQIVIFSEYNFCAQSRDDACWSTFEYFLVDRQRLRVLQSCVYPYP